MEISLQKKTNAFYTGGHPRGHWTCLGSAPAGLIVPREGSVARAPASAAGGNAVGPRAASLDRADLQPLPLRLPLLPLSLPLLLQIVNVASHLPQHLRRAQNIAIRGLLSQFTRVRPIQQKQSKVRAGRKGISIESQEATGRLCLKERKRLPCSRQSRLE